MPDGIWLTYEELGKRLKIKPDSARKKAERAQLERRTSNDGAIQILVDLNSPWFKGQPTPRRAKVQKNGQDTNQKVRQLETELDTLKSKLSDTKIELEIQRTKASERAERISDLKDQIETLKNPPRRRWFWG